MSNINYKTLKSYIIRACSRTSFDGVDFKVNIDKLKSSVANLSLIPVNINLISKNVDPEDIPFLSEYFEKKKLSWFERGNNITTLVFVDKSELTDEKKERLDVLLANMDIKQVDSPSTDKTSAMSEIVADYPCYFATIASYISNDPGRSGLISYIIVCRANKIVVKSSAYDYNPKDLT